MSPNVIWDLFFTGFLIEADTMLTQKITQNSPHKKGMP